MGKNKRTILLNGACGRMGQAIVNVCRNSSDFEIRYALEHPQHNKIGTNLYASRDKKKYSLKNIPIEKSIDKFKVDFVIDFSTPNSALKIAHQAHDLKIPFVTGTTGFTGTQLKKLQVLSKKIPILQSYNMSVGVNIVLKILKENISYFKTTNMEISETHHKGKIDSPSGTAKLIKSTILEAANRKFKINIDSKREGRVVGEHTLASYGNKENIFITHEALDREIFASGALIMGRELLRKRKGFYSIFDLIQ